MKRAIAVALAGVLFSLCAAGPLHHHAAGDADPDCAVCAAVVQAHSVPTAAPSIIATQTSVVVVSDVEAAPVSVPAAADPARAPPVVA